MGDGIGAAGEDDDEAASGLVASTDTGGEFSVMMGDVAGGKTCCKDWGGRAREGGNWAKAE